MPRFPTPPFAYDLTPFETHGVGDGVVRMGSFYGAADSPFALTPVRAFTTADSGLSPFGALWAHLVVLHVADDSYFVVACSVDPTPPYSPQYCTVSGTGAFAHTGRAFYDVVGASLKLVLHVYVTS